MSVCGLLCNNSEICDDPTATAKQLIRNMAKIRYNNNTSPNRDKLTIKYSKRECFLCSPCKCYMTKGNCCYSQVLSLELAEKSQRGIPSVGINLTL